MLKRLVILSAWAWAWAWACVGVANVALLQGELDITNMTAYVENTSYNIKGAFTDRSVSGFDGTMIATGDLVWVETIDGSCDPYAVTNIVSAAEINVDLDVEYYPAGGTSTLGVAVGVAAVCRMSTNNAGFALPPSYTGARVSWHMLNSIANWNYQRILDAGDDAVWGNITGDINDQDDLTNTVALAASALQPGANGTSTNLSDYNNDAGFVTTDTGATNIAAGASDSYDAGTRTLTWNTNAAGGGGLTEEQVRAVEPLMNNSSSISIGLSAQSSANSISLGKDTYSFNDAIAIGEGAHASGLNIAIGFMVSNTVEGTSRLYGRWDVDNNEITNCAAMTLGGERRTNWSSIGDASSAWSGSPATQDVDIAGNVITNVGTIYATNGAFSGTLTLDGNAVLTNAVGTTNASGIHVAHSAVAYSPATADVEAHIVGIDEALTNKVEWTNGASSDAFLKRDGSLPMTGELETPSLKITGGSPTNGAVFISTNTAGQGTWVAPSYVFASRTNDIVISNATITDITFNSEKVDLLSEFDGTTFTASMDGIYAVTGAVSWYTLVATKRYSLYIYAASNFYYYEYMPGANMTQMHQAFSEQIKLLQGQTVVIKVQQNTGGDEDILGSAGAHTRLQIARVVDL